MTQTYFRVQAGDDNRDLTDPAEQISRAWGHWHLDDADRHSDRVGVSVCASREVLARYLAGKGSGIPYGLPGWVLVELRGDISDDRPIDFTDGELLVHPTEIVAVAPIDEAFFDLIGAAYDELEASR
jgi:hypothetical protein